MQKILSKIKNGFLGLYILDKLWIIFILLILIITPLILYFNKTKNEIESENLLTNSSIFSQYVFDDYGGLKLENISAEIGYETGLLKYPILKWEDVLIYEEKENININVHYPKFIGDNIVKKLNKHIEDMVKNFIEEDKKEFKDKLEYAKSNPDDLLGDFGQNIDLSVNYRIIGVKNGVVSIELVTTNYTGGGNGNHDYSYAINWDLKSNKLLEINSLFCKKDYLLNIAYLSQIELMRRIPSDFDFNDDVEISNNNESIESIIDWIISGTEPQKDNFDNILPYKDGLFVVFQPYQVHSGASGIVRVYVRENEGQKIICLP